MLLIERKRLTECAHDKLRALGELLSESILERAATLFYASAKQPRQAREIEELLGRRNWRIRSVTSDDALTPAELSEILGDLARGEIDGIVAKKMLDEGVDVPAVRQAVLVASSKGEREWIQRRGRVLRMHPGKQSATIVDIVALPRPSDARLSAALKRYVEDELGRTIKFAKHALNRDYVVDGLIAQMKEYRNG
jgi:superfamily II DNA or RNA helicase